MKENSRQMLLSPFFLLGLFLLLLNDFFLKSYFHNFLTGKLSDFAGLFVFPLFFAAFFPQRKLFIYLSTAFLFLFWKSSFSQSLIDLWNSFQCFKIGRTIDYTDFSALSVLPLSYFYFKTETQNQVTFLLNFAKRVSASFIVLLSVFAFTATSYEEDRNLWFDNNYTFAGNKEEIVEKLKSFPKIARVEYRNEAEMFGNTMPQNTIDSNNYWLEFKIKEKFCDSENLSVTMFVKESNDITNLRLGFIRFWCKEKPTEENKKQVFQIFEKEVAEKLQLHPQSEKTQNEKK